MGLFNRKIENREGLSLVKEIYPIIQDIVKDYFFIETGTFGGFTSVWASTVFKKVFTVELSEEMYNIVSNKYKYINNICFSQGNSVDFLKTLLPELGNSCVFWLDAHFSECGTAGGSQKHTLIDEINTINEYSLYKDFIFIDDFRLICYPWMQSDNIYWPTITDVCLELTKGVYSRYTLIMGDCIVSFPEEYKDIFKKDILKDLRY